MEIHSPKEFIAQMQEMIRFMQKLHDQEHKVPASPEGKTERLKEFTELRMLLRSEEWPAAVEEENILDNDHGRVKALATLHTLVKNDMDGLKILDLNSEDGLCCISAVEDFSARKAVGYNPSQKMDEGREGYLSPVSRDDVTLTNQWSVVEENGPYDIIFANDILDHSNDFDKTLENVQKLRSQVSRIFIRCHPWVSRHGAHLHTQINKAYVHLVFSPDELQNMGYTTRRFTHRLLDPVASYKRLFQKLGLSVMKQEAIRSTVEPFFYTNESVMRRIKERWQTMSGYSDGKKFPREFMEIEVVDYTLI